MAKISCVTSARPQQVNRPRLLSSWSKDLFPTKTISRKDTGRRSAPIRALANPLPHASGLIAWLLGRGQSSRQARVRLTAEFTRSKEIRQAAWDCQTTLVGNGNRRPGSRLCAFPDVRCSQTILWKRCSTSFIWLQDAQPQFRSMTRYAPPGSLAPPCTKDVIGEATTNRQSLRTNTDRRSAL